MGKHKEMEKRPLLPIIFIGNKVLKIQEYKLTSQLVLSLKTLFQFLSSLTDSFRDMHEAQLRYRYSHRNLVLRAHVTVDQRPGNAGLG